MKNRHWTRFARDIYFHICGMCIRDRLTKCRNAYVYIRTLCEAYARGASYRVPIGVTVR